MVEQALSVGREVKTTGAKIVGVLSCVPARRIDNEFFIKEFGEGPVNDVVKMVGVQQRRWVDEKTSTRDLCRAAGKKLLEEIDWNPDTADALIFVSQTPDYRLPASACALQADLGLPTASVAFDVNLGCSGYPYALWLGMTMIQTGAARRVLLAVGDTISRIADKHDRSTALLFGDAGTVTALEACDGAEATFIMGTDGRGAQNLIVPAGAFKNHGDSGDPRLEGRNLDCLYMDGGEIFNFTLRAVPALVNRTMEFAGKKVDEYDGFLFHQANLFMLKHLAKKSKLPAERVPINIDQYGNTSSASIPLLITTKLRERLLTENLQLAMFGFGVGYSWASASLSVGPLACVEVIEV